jgi:tetratricopeptide (TPR) repeat protein
MQQISEGPDARSSDTAEQARLLFEQAIALHQAERLSEAEALYERIRLLQPKHADALHLLGVVAYQRGDHQKAADLIGEAIAARPGNAGFYANRGVALAALRQWDAALDSFERAIAIDPDAPDVHFNRGNALRELRRLEDALNSYDRTVAMKPDFVAAHYRRGVTLAELGRVSEAVASFDKTIAFRPDHADAHNNRGLALAMLGQMASAVGSFDKAIALRPEDASGYFNRGRVHKELGHWNEAIADFDDAIRLQPDHIESHDLRGVALAKLNRLDEALASLDRAIALNPQGSSAHWNRTLVLLLRGDWDEGWRMYREFASSRRKFSQPLWRGSEPLGGKTILLHSDHGLGDTIQFSRYANLVANLGARVIFETERPLVALMRSLRGAPQVVEKGAALPAFEYQCPLLGLPSAFRTTLENVPTAASYLGADSVKRSYWARRLGAKSKPRIGLVWSGNVRYANDAERSIPFEDFASLVTDDFEFFCLQKELRDADRSALSAYPKIAFFGEALNSFADTAALCDLMDLVITVDTSLAHLAGALGRPLWILLPFSPDWRWLLGRDDSPWYPTAKLYRQACPGSWHEVIDRVKSDLAIFDKS